MCQKEVKIVKFAKLLLAIKTLKQKRVVQRLCRQIVLDLFRMAEIELNEDLVTACVTDIR